MPWHSRCYRSINNTLSNTRTNDKSKSFFFVSHPILSQTADTTSNLSGHFSFHFNYCKALSNQD